MTSGLLHAGIAFLAVARAVPCQPDCDLKIKVAQEAKAKGAIPAAKKHKIDVTMVRRWTKEYERDPENCFGGTVARKAPLTAAEPLKVTAGNMVSDVKELAAPPAPPPQLVQQPSAEEFALLAMEFAQATEMVGSILANLGEELKRMSGFQLMTAGIVERMAKLAAKAG
jgi:hypothetical protein